MNNNKKIIDANPAPYPKTSTPEYMSVVTLINILDKQKVDIACFRDKESSNFEELAKTFIEICKKFNIKEILLNSNYFVVLHKPF